MVYSTHGKMKMYSWISDGCRDAIYRVSISIADAINRVSMPIPDAVVQPALYSILCYSSPTVNRVSTSIGTIFFTLFIISSSFVFSQNLVPNPSFEEYIECPTGYSGIYLLFCPPWHTGNLATPDYFNPCSNPSKAGVPYNDVGFQEAHTGEAYAGCIMSYLEYPWSEYLQVQLSEPCISGHNYEISFYVSLANFWNNGISKIDVYFSAVPPPVDTCGPLSVIPQFESQIGTIRDTSNWVLITGCFHAQGGEEWITIGNFSPYESLYTPYSYYYIDDVSVIDAGPGTAEIEILDLELGDTLFACDPFEIDPEVTGVEYYWSDGSTEPTLLVMTSGIYSLTISTGYCYGIGIDSVYVFFTNVPEGVDLGPPEATMCDGDSYIFSLDPNLGEYVWQDGSADPYYEITTTGVYHVSLDDGCDITTDTISILVTDLFIPDIAGVPEFVCRNDNPISLPKIQEGISGSWSGQNVTNNTFDPSGLDGMVTLTFTPKPGQCAGKTLINLALDPDVVGIISDTLNIGDSIIIEGTVYDLNHPQGTETILGGSVAGCDSIIMITLFFHPAMEDKIYVPNVFSPNGDGINDTWRIYSSDQEAELVSLRILDRWGGMLYSCADKLLSDSAVEWDGKMKGREMSGGVYVFVSVIKTNDGVSRQIKGDITLIR